MQASEFLDTAERLAQGTTEGDWRSAVSRVYYSVFHFFCDFFLTQGLDLGTGGQAHSSLSDNYNPSRIHWIWPLRWPCLKA